jgi:hypothetical protein
LEIKVEEILKRLILFSLDKSLLIDAFRTAKLEDITGRYPDAIVILI